MSLTTKEFSVKTSAKMFQVLSSNLYTDKITSVMRELSCNAWDSHVAAGNESTPFEVMIPTDSSSLFYVRDYGTGLSREQLLNVYTTYFESTKTDDDKQVGALGLGSKSPFSLVNEFVVTSYYNNTEYVCVVRLSDKGVPTMNIVAEAKTAQPNGLKVEFEKQWTSSELYEFKESAITLYRWFPLVPMLKWKSTSSIEKQVIQYIKPPEFVKEFSFESEKLIVLPKHNWSNEIYVKQGIVVYGVSRRSLSGYIDNEYYDIIGSLLAKYSILIDVPIGSVDVAASREALSLDQNTIDLLCKKLTTFVNDITRVVENKICLHKNNPWEFNKAVLMLRSVLPRSVVDSLVDNYCKKTGTKKFVSFDLGHDVINKTNISVYHIGSVKQTLSSKNKNPFDTSAARSIINSNLAETVVLVNDTTRGPLTLAREFAVTADAKVLVVVDFVNRKQYNEQDVKTLLTDVMGGVPNRQVVYLSSIRRSEQTKKVPNTTKTINDLYCQYFCNYSNKWIKRRYTDILNNAKSNNRELWFVDLEHKTAVLKNGIMIKQHVFGKITSVLSMLQPTGNSSIVVCGFTKSQQKLATQLGVEVKSLTSETLKCIAKNKDKIEKMLEYADTTNQESPLPGDDDKYVIFAHLIEVPEIKEFYIKLGNVLTQLNSDKKITRNYKTILWVLSTLITASDISEFDDSTKELIARITNYENGFSKEIKQLADKICPVLSIFSDRSVRYSNESTKRVIECLNMYYKNYKK